MRTLDEITTEIKKLNMLKDSLPEFDFFGGNNYDKIDAQISIIKGYTNYEDYEGHDDLEPDVYEANQWLNGEIDSLVDDDEF